MGAIANAIAEFAQPLLDATDGSMEDLNSALAVSQVCWNLALLPEDAREESLAKMRLTLDMDDDEFDDFRCSVVLPMIQRHEEMFPQMHGGRSARPSSMEPSRAENSRPVQYILPPSMAARSGKYPGTGRNAPCPCHSGRKYKVCCGR
ncbi:MAG: SEC-C domain-containing protein [Planctomycetia bacterium]|nr:SEC-C domain-containing protein [Planctomycetia bacterium]